MPTERREDLKAHLEAMPPARWQQINAVLDAALDLPPDERAAYLDAHTTDDPALRKEVEALLASFEKTEGILDQPAAALAKSVLPLPKLPSLEGQHVGAYRVLRQIGEGGMGMVYLAERDDVQKKVALKLVRDSLASPEHVQRFLFERRLLARLEHANIARLLDAGVTEQGAPYFAMEYVEGEAIDAYCDTQRLSINERLRLFQTVCRVVQYAHQNLVVHRDLKPSNILVTEEGDVRLLDFGIAKLLEEEAADQTLLTRTGARLMTPAYASPEQFRGDPVTTTSDIYSLGVILYELLTGQRPYEETDSRTLERTLTRTAPRKPSTAIIETARRTDGETTTITEARATTVDKLRRRLSGDLDTICLKALRSEPERRYPSAEQFLEDIRRHLAGLPVTARKDTVGYRLQKFVQRNRLGVAAVVAVFLALLGGIVATTWQAQIARAERDRAEQVASILPEVFWGLEPGELQNTAVTPEQMLDRGIEQVETRLVDQPEIQARVLTLATDLYMRLAAYPKAEAVARQALAIRQDLYGQEHENVAASMAMLAQSLDKQGRYDEAEPLHRDALAMRRKFLGDEHLDVATSLHNYAMLLDTQGQYEESEEFYREALDIRRKLDADPRDIAVTQTNLAIELYYQDDYDEAERYTREALALRKEHLGNEHPDVAHGLHTLAAILQAKGELDEVEALFRETLAIHRKSHGDSHPVVGYTLNSLGLVLKEKGDYDEAEALLAEALTILKEAHGEENSWVATVLHNLGLVQTARGDYAAAEPLYRQAVAMERRVSGEEHPNTAGSLRALGSFLIEKGTPAAAEPILREALAIYQNTLPEGHHKTALSQSTLGACLAALDRNNEAEPLLRDGFERLREKLGLEHTNSQTALRRLVDFLEGQGRQEEAAHYDTLFSDQEVLQP